MKLDTSYIVDWQDENGKIHNSVFHVKAIALKLIDDLKSIGYKKRHITLAPRSYVFYSMKRK
jgi:gamma-glutamylcyclotransferase (GGCT)/AIG2-like uncharacterized protein YtfP